MHALARYRLVDEDTGIILQQAAFKPMPAHMAADAAVHAVMLVRHAQKLQRELADFAAQHPEPDPEDLSVVQSGDEKLRDIIKTVNGAYGYLLSKVLAEPELPELPEECRTPIDRGLHVYNALFDIGWSHGEIERLYGAANAYVNHLKEASQPKGMPDLSKVKEVLDFGETRPAQGSQTGS